MAIDKKGTKQIADNKAARHNYFVLEQIECGIELVGTEGIYAIGDGAGFTRSLSQAAANGLYVADKILSGK